MSDFARLNSNSKNRQKETDALYEPLVPLSDDSVGTPSQHAYSEHASSGQSYARLDTPHPAGSHAGSSADSSEKEKQSNERQLLLHASQMASQLQQRLDSVNRRESNLHAQLMAFENEQRQFQLWKQQVEGELKDRNLSVSNAESQVQQRLEDCKTLAIQIEQKNPELVELLTSGRGAKTSVLENTTSGLNDLISLAAAWSKDRYQMTSAIQSLTSEKEELRQIAESKKIQEQLAQLEQHRLQSEKQQKQLRKQDRFQKEHLQKLRGELDSSRTTLLRDVQTCKTGLQQEQSLVQMRQKQIARYRERLEEKETSLHREQALIDDKKVMAEESILQLKDDLSRQKESFFNQKKTELDKITWRKKELHHQEELLLQKQSQFLILKKDLEAAHRKILVMRTVVQRAWGELSPLDPEGVRKRFEELQQDLNDSKNYEEISDSERLEQLTHMESQLAIIEQSNTEELNLAITQLDQRYQELQDREEEFQKTAMQLEQQREHEDTLRDKWLAEKFQAEKIIRGLLDQLDHQAGQNQRAA